jgi:hypothetical protein
MKKKEQKRTKKNKKEQKRTKKNKKEQKRTKKNKKKGMMYAIMTYRWAGYSRSSPLTTPPHPPPPPPLPSPLPNRRRVAKECLGRKRNEPPGENRSQAFPGWGDTQK